MDAPAVQPDRTMPVTLADIAELPLIAPSKRQAVRYLLEAAFERQSVKFRPVLEATGVLMVLELVRAGLGYAVMPASVFRPYNAFSELRSADITPVIRRTISVIVRTSVAEDRAVSSFREMVLELLPELTRTTRFGPVAIYPTAQVKR
jgi:LysR family nitrogen assimilation transcriptional regulator